MTRTVPIKRRALTHPDSSVRAMIPRNRRFIPRVIRALDSDNSHSHPSACYTSLRDSREPLRSAKNHARCVSLSLSDLPTLSTSATSGNLQSSTFTPTSSELGKKISVRVTGSKAGYDSADATSAATAAVVDGTTKPVNSALPTITGTRKVGNVVTANPGTWTPGPAQGVTFTYQWKMGTTVLGMAQTLTLPASTANKSVTVIVTAKSANPSSTSATSARGAGPLCASFVSASDCAISCAARATSRPPGESVL